MGIEAIIGGIITLSCGGGLIYLIVDKLFSKKQDNANAQSTIIHNGNEIAELYVKIDEIVASKTRPIQESLDVALARIDLLEKHFCCYRKDCEMRIRNKNDITNAGQGE